MGMEVPNMRFKCIYDALEHLNILLYIVMEELNRLLHFRVSESVAARPKVSHVTESRTPCSAAPALKIEN